MVTQASNLATYLTLIRYLSHELRIILLADIFFMICSYCRHVESIKDEDERSSLQKNDKNTVVCLLFIQIFYNYFFSDLMFSIQIFVQVIYWQVMPVTGEGTCQEIRCLFVLQGCEGVGCGYFNTLRWVLTQSLFSGKVPSFDHGSLDPGKVFNLSNFAKQSLNSICM